MKNLTEARGFKNSAIGTIMAWTGTTGDIPSGWVACDGTTYPNSQYPQLLEVIGYTYGGSAGSSTFTVPSLNTTNKLPVHSGSAYTGTGGAANSNIVLNATWSIENRPNKVVSFQAPSSIVSNGPGQCIWEKEAFMQPRVMSHENLPMHTHVYNFTTHNNQFTNNPSIESGGSTKKFSGGVQQIQTDFPGTTNSDHSTRMDTEPTTHEHGKVKYTVQRGSIQITPYTRDYDTTNSTVALNNNPGVGNATLKMTPPYQTAIYIIKAF